MANLKNIKVRAVALVDKGANRKEFFLFKNNKGDGMDKEKVLELLKSGNLNKEQVQMLIKDMSDEDKTEIQAFVDSEAGISVMKAEDFKKVLTEVVVEELEKSGAKFNKANAEALKRISDMVDNLKKAVDAITESIKGLPKKEDEKKGAKTKEELKKAMENKKYNVEDDEVELASEIIADKAMEDVK